MVVVGVLLNASRSSAVVVLAAAPPNDGKSPKYSSPITPTLSPTIYSLGMAVSGGRAMAKSRTARRKIHCRAN